MLGMSPGPERDARERTLTERMLPGSIDVNIMTKLDRLTFTREGRPLSDEFSDAKTALRGHAESALNSAIVLSAGLLAYEQWLLRDGDLGRLDLAFFTMNGYISIIIFTATLLAVLTGGLH